VPRRHNSGIGQFAVIQSVAPSLGVERDAGEIGRVLTAFSANGGLIVTASGVTAVRRDLIVWILGKRIVIDHDCSLY
jgi:hypothetical protein